MRTVCFFSSACAVRFENFDGIVRNGYFEATRDSIEGSGVGLV